MKLHLFILSLFIITSGCRDASNDKKAQVVFDYSTFDKAFVESLDELGWKGRAGSGNSSSAENGSNHIGKYSKDEDSIFVYFEMSSDKREAYNLYFIGQFDHLDETPTSRLVDALILKLPWLKEKAVFIDDIQAVRRGIRAN